MNMRPLYYYVADNGYVRVMTDPNGNLSPLVILKTPAAKRFSGLALIKKDIDLIKEALASLENGVQNKIVKQSLSFFAIVTYGKCYAQAEGRGLSLNIDAVKDLPQEVKDEHHRLIKQRNQYVAHGGGQGWEQNPIVASLNLAESRYDDIYENIVFLNDIDSQMKNFRLLVAFVEDYINDQLKKTYSRIKQETVEADFQSLVDASFIPERDKLHRF